MRQLKWQPNYCAKCPHLLLQIYFREYHRNGIHKLWSLASFHSTNVSEVHSCCWTYKSFILFIVIQYSIMWIFLNLLTHSPVASHLGCFQLLVIMNKPTTNIQTGFCMNIQPHSSGVNTQQHRCQVVQAFALTLKKLPNHVFFLKYEKFSNLEYEYVVHRMG